MPISASSWLNDNGALQHKLGRRPVELCAIAEATRFLRSQIPGQSLAGTFDGSDLAIYINGEEKARAPAPTDTVPDTPEPLQVGNRLAGILDDFVMYSRVLTGDEIKAIMEGSILPVEIKGKLATTWASVKGAE